MPYEVARRDFEYLESLAEVTDMVEIDAQVWYLMRKPTKAMAAKMYESSIRLWLGEHREKFLHDEEVLRINEEYGY